MGFEWVRATPGLRSGGPPTVQEASASASSWGQGHGHSRPAEVPVGQAQSDVLWFDASPDRVCKPKFAPPSLARWHEQLKTLAGGL